MPSLVGPTQADTCGWTMRVTGGVEGAVCGLQSAISRLSATPESDRPS